GTGLYVEGFVLVPLFMENEPPFHTINGIKMQTGAGSAEFALGGRLSAYDSRGPIGSADDADHKSIVEDGRFKWFARARFWSGAIPVGAARYIQIATRKFRRDRITHKIIMGGMLHILHHPA